MVSLALISALVIVGAAAMLFIGVRSLGQRQFRERILVMATVTVAYALLLQLQPHSWLVSDIVVIAVAIVIGILIGGALRSEGAIVAFCVTAALVDVLSFSGGFTRSIIESYHSGDSRTLIYLSLAVPFSGTVRPIVGIGDLIILAGLFTGFSHVGYGGWLPFAAPVGGLLLALGIGLAVGGTPALPFIAAVIVLYVLFQRRRRPEDN